MNKEERLAYFKEMKDRTWTPEDKKIIAEKWEKTNLLKALPKEYAEEAAAALETQRLYNERVSDRFVSPQQKRISIPVIRRVFAGLLARDLDVRSEPKKQPYWLELPELVFDDPMNFNNLLSQHNLDEEAELTAKVCEKICNELAKKAKMNQKATVIMGVFTNDRMGVAQMNYGLA